MYDLSTEDGNDGVNFVMFRPEADMPQATLGDVVLITSAKVQRFRSDPISLITNRSTSIRVYAALKIPKPPQSAHVALVQAPGRDRHKPSAEEHAYVSYIFHKIDKYSLPDEQEFQQRAAQSLNVTVKKKFSLLQDVQAGTFCDLVAQVAREPYAGGYEGITLYVSDYTENPHFHQQVWQGLPESVSGNGDPYGYTAGDTSTPKTDWIGPYGKMSLQITCYEPHSTYVRAEVRAGQWVMLRNVQIKYGHDGQFLEGFMRGQRNNPDTRVNVHVLDIGDRETIDPNLKEAIRRWRDYTKKKKQQLKQLKSAEAAGQKRKATIPLEQEERPFNSKSRRKRNRAAKEQKEKESPVNDNLHLGPNDQKEKESPVNDNLRLGLNDQVTCERHDDAPYSTIESILEPPVYNTSINNKTTALTMPFTCAKHQARVRVVDFFPPSLDDFVCRRKQSYSDVLSDDGSGSDSASSSDDEDMPGVSYVLEWRFALQLEDTTPPPSTANPSGPRPRLWVFVDNYEGQCLTGLDAADLHQDTATLAQLRERMFTLWGNLEELKQARTAEQKQRKHQVGANGKHRLAQIEKPPLSSDPVDEGEGTTDDAVSNKPFNCCIKQYGVYEGEGEGGGKWVRCFGLFGTKICG